MDLYLLRHAEAEINMEETRIRTLTRNGREQVKGLADKSKSEGISFDSILTSPYKRTVETAKIMGEELSCPIYKEELFNGI